MILRKCLVRFGPELNFGARLKALLTVCVGREIAGLFHPDASTFTSVLDSVVGVVDVGYRGIGHAETRSCRASFELRRRAGEGSSEREATTRKTRDVVETRPCLSTSAERSMLINGAYREEALEAASALKCYKTKSRPVEPLQQACAKDHLSQGLDRARPSSSVAVSSLASHSLGDRQHRTAWTALIPYSFTPA